MYNTLLDSKATTTLHHNNLMTSEVHVGVLNNNIEQFNQYVHDNRQALKNGCHDIDEGDMLKCLWHAYLAQGSKFNNYITLLQKHQ